MFVYCVAAANDKCLQYTDRVSPLMNHVETMAESFDISSAPMMAQMFGNAGVEHMRKYGAFPCCFDVLI